MPSDAQKKSRNKWDSANMTVVGCKVKKSDADRYKAAAEALGTTISAVCRDALEKMAKAAAQEEGRE